jgi:sulfur carrier protein ThiS
MAKGKIKIHFGRLVDQIRVSNVSEGTTLSDFLTKREIKYGSAIRVNGKVIKKDYVLRNDDIITEIDNVDGGKN